MSSPKFVSATNGWSPVERNRSNGENSSGDGGPITIKGTVHPTGLGVHAEPLVEVYLGGRCSLSPRPPVSTTKPAATAG